MTAFRRFERGWQAESDFRFLTGEICRMIYRKYRSCVFSPANFHVLWRRGAFQSSAAENRFLGFRRGRSRVKCARSVPGSLPAHISHRTSRKSSQMANLRFGLFAGAQASVRRRSDLDCWRVRVFKLSVLQCLDQISNGKRAKSGHLCIPRFFER